MRYVTKYYVLAILIGLLLVNALSQERTADSVTQVFKEKAGAYVTKQSEIKSGLPALPTEATADQLAAHKASLLKGVKASRTSAKRGDLFTSDAVRSFRKVIRQTFNDAELAEFRTTVVGAETAGVKVQVNAVYPEAKEKLEMPPRLLLALPELPDELRYRFVGKYLMVVDKESGLILDFMSKAIP